MIASPSQLAPLLAALGLTAQFNDNLKGFLGQLNYLQALNDALYVYLESLGYQGDLNTKIKLWEIDGYPLTGGVVVVTPPTLDVTKLVTGNQIQTAFVAGSYTYSSAVTETVLEYKVNGAVVAGSYVLATGDLVGSAKVRLTATGLTNPQDIFTEVYGITDFNYTTADLSYTVPAGVVDTTAPILSSPAVTVVDATHVNFAFSTDEVGTAYWVKTASATSPTAQQIIDGKDEAGVAVTYFGPQSIVATGAQTLSNIVVGNGSGAYIHVVVEDASGNRSNIVKDGPLTTATAPSQMSAPTLASTATRITITLAADPAANGSPITDRQYRYSTDAGGSWSSPVVLTSGDVLPGMTPGATGILVQTRARNAVDSNPNNWSSSTSIDMKNITFLGFTANSGTGATYDIDLTTIDTSTGGAGGPLVEGDFGISATGWSVSNANGDPGISGWTEEDDLYGDDETRDINFSASWKVMGSTPDSVATVTASNNAANGACGVIAWYRYVDPITPISTKGTAVIGKDTASADAPTVTPTLAGSLPVVVVGATGDTTPADLVAPSGFTLAGRRNAGGTTRGVRFLIAHQTWTSGAVDPAAVTSSENATSDSWAANVYVLKPY